MNFLSDTRRVFLVIVAMGLFAMAVRPATDPDLWWHLRAGQLIVQTRTVPHVDPFSFTRAGQPWIAHEWLSEVILYTLYSHIGGTGLILVFGLITAVAMMLIYWRSPGRPFIAALMTVWGATAAAPSWGARPQTFSFLFASLFLLIIEKSATRPRLLWCTVPVMVLWVNLHAGYAVGLALLALAWLGSWLDEKWEATSGDQWGPWRKRLILMMVLCAAVVPLNPNGFRLYLYPLQTLHSGAMNQYIAEWASPNFHQLRFLPFAAMLIAVLGLAALSRRGLRPSEILYVLVFTFAALRSVRHIPLFVLVAVPVVSSQAATWWRKWRPESDQHPASPSRLAMNATILLAFLAFTLVRTTTIAERQPASEVRNFPADAVRYIEASPLPAPMLNQYSWGGYLIWELYPKYRVFIDGRADVYGDSFMKDFADLYYLKNNWSRLLTRWQIHSVLLPPQAPLVTALRQMPGWTQVYGDSQAVILVRDRAGVQAHGPTYGTKVLSLRN